MFLLFAGDMLYVNLLQGPEEDDSIRRTVAPRTLHPAPAPRVVSRTISDWWENLPLVGQSESRTKRRRREEASATYLVQK